MKQVTITKEDLRKAWESSTCNYVSCFDGLCVALGLTDPPKRKVKLLAFIRKETGALFWAYEEPLITAGMHPLCRVPSEDREIEIIEVE